MRFRLAPMVSPSNGCSEVPWLYDSWVRSVMASSNAGWHHDPWSAARCEHPGRAVGLAPDPAVRGDVLAGVGVIRLGAPPVQRDQAGRHHLQAGEVLLDLRPGAA